WQIMHCRETVAPWTASPAAKLGVACATMSTTAMALTPRFNPPTRPRAHSVPTATGCIWSSALAQPSAVATTVSLPKHGRRLPNALDYSRDLQIIYLVGGLAATGQGQRGYIAVNSAPLR